MTQKIPESMPNKMVKKPLPLPDEEPQSLKNEEMKGTLFPADLNAESVATNLLLLGIVAGITALTIALPMVGLVIGTIFLTDALCNLGLFAKIRDAADTTAQLLLLPFQPNNKLIAKNKIVLPSLPNAESVITNLLLLGTAVGITLLSVALPLVGVVIATLLLTNTVCGLDLLDQLHNFAKGIAQFLLLPFQSAEEKFDGESFGSKSGIDFTSKSAITNLLLIGIVAGITVLTVMFPLIGLAIATLLLLDDVHDLELVHKLQNLANSIAQLLLSPFQSDTAKKLSEEPTETSDEEAVNSSNTKQFTGLYFFPPEKPKQLSDWDNKDTANVLSVC